MFIRVNGLAESHVWEFQTELTDEEVKLNIFNRFGKQYPFQCLIWNELTLFEQNKILMERLKAIEKVLSAHKEALSECRDKPVKRGKLQKFDTGSKMIPQ